MKSIKLPLPPQYNTGPFIGSLLFLYGRGWGLVSIFTTLLSIGTWYVVTTDRWPELSAIPLWGFVLIFGAFFSLIMILTHMFVTPSVIAYNNLQSCLHENPIMKELAEIKKIMAEIKAQKGDK